MKRQENNWRYAAECSVWTLVIINLAPTFCSESRFYDAEEEILIKIFVSHANVEGLDECVFLRGGECSKIEANVLATRLCLKRFDERLGAVLVRKDFCQPLRRGSAV